MLAALTTPRLCGCGYYLTKRFSIPTEPASATTDPISTPEPFASFTAPLPLPMPEPVKEEPPLEDTLVYEEDVNPSSSDLSPKMEQSLLDPPPEEEIEKPKPSTPSEEDIKEAAMFSPSDLHQYDYAINCQSGIISRFPKGPDPTKPLATSIIQQDVVSSDPVEAPPQKKQKVSNVKIWPKKDSGHTLLYRST